MSYAINEKKIIYADLDPREGVVLNLDTKNYYRLNETGQLIWQRLSAGQSEDEIAGELTKRYDVTEEEAKADIDGIVSQLKREHLIS